MRSRDFIVIVIPFILTAAQFIYHIGYTFFSRSLFFNPKLQCPIQWIPALTSVIYKLNWDFPDRVYCTRIFVSLNKTVCYTTTALNKMDVSNKRERNRSITDVIYLFFFFLFCFDPRYTFWPAKMKRSWQLKDENEKLNGDELT